MRGELQPPEELFQAECLFGVELEVAGNQLGKVALFHALDAFFFFFLLSHSRMF